MPKRKLDECDDADGGVDVQVRVRVGVVGGDDCSEGEESSCGSLPTVEGGGSGGASDDCSGGAATDGSSDVPNAHDSGKVFI